jgi:hypothetical protein
VIPLQLEAAARGGRCTRGAALKQIQGMGTRRYVLSVDNPLQQIKKEGEIQGGKCRARTMMLSKADEAERTSYATEAER